MIQFNLLPDVKLEYIKARRMKRLIATIASGCMAASIAITVLLFVLVNVLQSRHLADLSKDIKTNSAKLEGSSDLNKILTIQNQLQSLPALNAQKPASSRVFGYMSQITPAKVSMASIKLDYTGNTIIINGSAESLATINTFVDTLKFTQYTKKGDTTKTNAFTQVVLTTFGRDDKGASYSISLVFDPVIFDNAQEVTLAVPSQVTTRSETEKPDSLFQPLSNTTTGVQK